MNICKSFISKLWELFLWIWQLPQHLVGLVLIAVMWLLYKDDFNRFTYPEYVPLPVKDYTIIEIVGLQWGVSLGKYIVIGSKFSLIDTCHEMGHSIQSQYLGPIYLIVVGIPSLMWASMYEPCLKETNKYYKYWTEKWADKLANVKRID